MNRSQLLDRDIGSFTLLRRLIKERLYLSLQVKLGFSTPKEFRLILGFTNRHPLPSEVKSVPQLCF